MVTKPKKVLVDQEIVERALAVLEEVSAVSRQVSIENVDVDLFGLRRALRKAIGEV